MGRHAHLLGTEEYLTTVTQFLLLRTYVAIFLGGRLVVRNL